MGLHYVPVVFSTQIKQSNTHRPARYREWVQVDIPTCHFSERLYSERFFFFFYSERVLFRKVVFSERFDSERFLSENSE